MCILILIHASSVSSHYPFDRLQVCSISDGSSSLPEFFQRFYFANDWLSVCLVEIVSKNVKRF